MAEWQTMVRMVDEIGINKILQRQCLLCTRSALYHEPCCLLCTTYLGLNIVFLLGHPEAPKGYRGWWEGIIQTQEMSTPARKLLDARLKLFIRHALPDLILDMWLGMVFTDREDT